MPPGNSVHSKSACSLPRSPSSAKLLFATAALLLVGAALGLSGLAVRLVAHSHFALLASVPAGLHLGDPFLRSVLFGTAGLLVFFLLRAMLGLIRMLIYSSTRTLPDRPPSAPVEESGTPTPQLPQSPASPDAVVQPAPRGESRFRTRAHFSRLKGRVNDYSGPYRRATDRRPDADYTDPLRWPSDCDPPAPTLQKS